MRDSWDVFELRDSQDTVAHPVIDYSKSWKGTEEAREMDPYATRKVMGVDYRFWNVFHSNFYAIAILPARKGKICKIQYIDFDDLQEKSLNSTLLSGSVTDLSLQPSCLSSMIGMWRS
jgi:hypothetical protein